MESVHNLITKARGEERMTFKGAKISFHVLGFDHPTSPVSTVLIFNVETDIDNNLNLNWLNMLPCYFFQNALIGGVLKKHFGCRLCLSVWILYVADEADELCE